jgi:lipid A oxidase
LAIPNVDVVATGTNRRTREFEITGPAVRGIAGVKYDLTDHWALFSEYQFTYSDNEGTIQGDPGQNDGDIDFELLTHALNVGFSYSF